MDGVVFYPVKVWQTAIGYLAKFSDFKDLKASGDDLNACLNDCKKQLNKYCLKCLDKDIEILEPSEPHLIRLDSNEKLVYVEVNFQFLKEKLENKSVVKTVSLPKWLHTKVVENDISLSQVLQEALKEVLKEE